MAMSRFRFGWRLCGIPKADGEFLAVCCEYSRGIMEMSSQWGREFRSYVCFLVRDNDCILVRMQEILSSSFVEVTKTAKFRI
jgi:hypothetical protein